MDFQTRVLRQLKNEQPLLRGFFPVVDPRFLEEINQWYSLKFKYADRLPALVLSDEWEEYEATNRFLERRILRGPYVPSDWSTTVQMFSHDWRSLCLASAHVNGRAEHQGQELFRNPLIRRVGDRRTGLSQYGLGAWSL